MKKSFQKISYHWIKILRKLGLEGYFLNMSEKDLHLLELMVNNWMLFAQDLKLSKDSTLIMYIPHCPGFLADAINHERKYISKSRKIGEKNKTVFLPDRIIYIANSKWSKRATKNNKWI